MILVGVRTNNDLCCSLRPRLHQQRKPSRQRPTNPRMRKVNPGGFYRYPLSFDVEKRHVKMDAPDWISIQFSNPTDDSELAIDLGQACTLDVYVATICR